jgi:hypothetical protein
MAPKKNVLPQADRDRLRRLVDGHGLLGASQRIRLSPATTASLIAGIPTQIGSVAQATLALAAIATPPKIAS